MLWWYAVSRRGHHMAIPDRRKHRRRRQIPPSISLTHETWPAPGWSTATLTGRSSLGWSTANSSEHHAALKTRLVRHGPDYARFPQEHCRVVQCAWNQARNPITRCAEPAAFQVTEFRGICPVTTCEPRVHRTSHARRRSLTPPCLPAGGQQFCGPQSRQAGAVAPRRAL